MTREAFIRKWLGNRDYPYNEQNRDLMRDDLDRLINKNMKAKIFDTYNNIFHNETFYSELQDLLEELDILDENGKLDVKDDFTLIIQPSILEPIIKFTDEWIIDRIDEERFSENNIENELDKLTAIFRKYIDFEIINKELPKLYYGLHYIELNKKDIEEYLNYESL